MTLVWTPKGRGGPGRGRAKRSKKASSVYQTSLREGLSPRFLLNVKGESKTSRGRGSRKVLLPVVLEEEKGVFGAWIPCLPGCAAMGDTREDALQNLKAALNDILALHKERGTSPKFRAPKKEDLSVDPGNLTWVSVPW